MSSRSFSSNTSATNTPINPYAPITVPKDASFADMVALKGKPEGRADEFWHAAEVELNSESDSPDAPTEETQPNKNSMPG